MEEKISDRINSRNGKSFLYHNNLAVFFKHKGFFSKALKEYEKAREKWETVLRIDPNNRFVKESLK